VRWKPCVEEAAKKLTMETGGHAGASFPEMLAEISCKQRASGNMSINEESKNRFLSGIEERWLLNDAMLLPERLE